MWLNQLKIAILEKNLDKLNELMENLPQLEKKEDMIAAIYLIKEAKRLVEILRDNTQASMVQMKKNITFLKSTQEKHTSKFDIKL